MDQGVREERTVRPVEKIGEKRKSVLLAALRNSGLRRPVHRREERKSEELS